MGFQPRKQFLHLCLLYLGAWSDSCAAENWARTSSPDLPPGTTAIFTQLEPASTSDQAVVGCSQSFSAGYHGSELVLSLVLMLAVGPGCQLANGLVPAPVALPHLRLPSSSL